MEFFGGGLLGLFGLVVFCGLFGFFSFSESYLEEV